MIKFSKNFINYKSTVNSELNKIFNYEQFGLIIVHNTCILLLLVWGAYALKNIIEQCKIKTVCVNHDFYFERDYFTNSSNTKLPAILKDIFPAVGFIEHEAINFILVESL